MSSYKVTNTDGIVMSADGKGLSIPVVNGISNASTSVPAGTIIYDSSNQQIYRFNGSAWLIAAGSSGTAGSAGSSGTSGVSGSAGTSGSSGSAGTAGSSGSTGTAGSSGSSGSTGTSGSAGSAGSSGSTGTAGSSGSSGSSGSTGSSGSSGAAGAPGSAGSSGSSGSSGSTGTSGSSGASVPGGFSIQYSGTNLSSTSYISGQISYSSASLITNSGDLRISGVDGNGNTIQNGIGATVLDRLIDLTAAGGGTTLRIFEAGDSSKSNYYTFSSFSRRTTPTNTDAIFNTLTYIGGSGTTTFTRPCISIEIAGSAGSSGTSGTRGSSGSAGSSGSSGSTGSSGSSGQTGSPGSSGSSGSSGTSGTRGSSGSSGSSGFTGSSGSTGTSGSSGQSAAVSITNNVDNYIVTATGNSSTPFNGESRLTYDGSTLTINPTSSTTASTLAFGNGDNATIASYYSMVFQVNSSNTQSGRTYAWNKAGTGYGNGTNIMSLDADTNSLSLNGASRARSFNLSGAIVGEDPDVGTLEGLVGWFVGDSYNATDKIWYDISGAGNHTNGFRGSPVKTTFSSGTKNSFKSYSTVTGGTGDGLLFPSAILPSTYTLFHVARYNGATKRRIFDGYSTNWLSGFWGERSGQAFHQGWITNSSIDYFSDNWVLSTDQNSLYRGQSNSIINSGTGGGGTSDRLSINAGYHTGGSGGGPGGETSDWMVAEVIVFNRTLTENEIAYVETYLGRKYGLPLYNNYFLGNIGIGTTAPGGRLTIREDGGANWQQYLITPNTNNRRNSIGFFDSGSANIASILTDMDANNTANFGISVPNGSPRLTITSAGHVGIGTTTPSSRLVVSNTSNFENTIFNARSDGGYLIFQESGTTRAYFQWGLTITGSANGNYILITNAENGGNIALQTSSSGGTFNSSALVVSSDGNIGIGTSTPGGRLTVNGNVRINGDINYSAQVGITQPSSGNALNLTNQADADLTFMVTQSGAGSKYAMIQPSVSSQSLILNGTNGGNVGIGTTEPSVRLQVVGSNTTEGQLYVGNTDVTYSAGINFTTSGTNRGFVGWRHTNSGSPYTLTGIHLFNTDNSNIVFGTNGAVRAVINLNGNFGIGTPTPTYRLEVVTSGTLAQRLQSSNSTVGNPIIDIYDSGRVQETVISSTDGTTTGTYIASYSNHPLLFGTNAGSSPTAKVRMQADSADTPISTMKIAPGGIIWGGNNNGKEINSCQISAGYHQSNSMNLVGMSSGTASTDRRIDFWVEGGAFFRGTVTATGDVVAYGSTSDIRLKKNLKPITGAIDSIKSVNGYTFQWNDLAPEEKRDKTEYGVIAQEVEAAGLDLLIRDYVRPVNKTGGDDTPPEVWKSVQYEKFVPLLIEAIKELNQKVEDQQSIIDSLLNKQS